MESTVSESNNEHQWIGNANNEMKQRVQQWMTEGRTLVWMPIWSRENFPSIPPRLLQLADKCSERQVMLINTVEDFLKIPQGITGWLLPEGEKDTDIVVGLWDNTAHFMKAADKRTGEPQTLQSGRTWETEDCADIPTDSSQT